MNRFLAIFFILTLIIGIFYCNATTISIKPIRENGKILYIYNGKKYNTMDEVKEQLGIDYPDSQYGRAAKTTKRPLVNENNEIPPAPEVATQPPSIINNKNNDIPTDEEINNLYVFDIQKEKGNHPFSNKIYDYFWNGYDYKTDYKNGFIDMKRRFMEESNYYRSVHGSPQLTVDPVLEEKALAYAKVLADTGVYVHDPTNKAQNLGENIAVLSGTLGSLAVKKWYDEIDMYNFQKNQHVPGTGHFTALVWKSSTKAGFGIVLKDGNLHIICKYSPRGNMKPLFPQNVSPRLSTVN